MFALIPFITLPNCWPPPSLNHNNTLSDMPTYHLLSLLSVWSFFSLICILKAKSKAKGIARNCISTNRKVSEVIVICPLFDIRTVCDVLGLTGAFSMDVNVIWPSQISFLFVHFLIFYDSLCIYVPFIVSLSLSSLHYFTVLSFFFPSFHTYPFPNVSLLVFSVLIINLI